MKIHEYQTRDFFRAFGIPVNDYKLAYSPSEARELSLDWQQTVIKAQVLTGGRGKAGGVKLAKAPDEVEKKAKAILGAEHKRLQCRKDSRMRCSPYSQGILPWDGSRPLQSGNYHDAYRSGWCGY